MYGDIFGYHKHGEDITGIYWVRSQECYYSQLLIIHGIVFTMKNYLAKIPAAPRLQDLALPF